VRLGSGDAAHVSIYEYWSCYVHYA
jgi:hypothetical protein